MSRLIIAHISFYQCGIFTDGENCFSGVTHYKVCLQPCTLVEKGGGTGKGKGKGPSWDCIFLLFIIPITYSI